MIHRWRMIIKYSFDRISICKAKYWFKPANNIHISTNIFLPNNIHISINQFNLWAIPIRIVFFYKSEKFWEFSAENNNSTFIKAKSFHSRLFRICSSHAHNNLKQTILRRNFLHWTLWHLSVIRRKSVKLFWKHKLSRWKNFANDINFKHGCFWRHHIYTYTVAISHTYIPLLAKWFHWKFNLKTFTSEFIRVSISFRLFFFSLIWFALLCLYRITSFVVHIQPKSVCFIVCYIIIKPCWSH